MPEISRFLGIIVTMWYDDHSPPHFQARYAEYEVAVAIESSIFYGQFPKRAQSLLAEWLEMHREELLDDWRLAGEDKPLHPIPPLE